MSEEDEGLKKHVIVVENVDSEDVRDAVVKYLENYGKVVRASFVSRYTGIADWADFVDLVIVFETDVPEEEWAEGMLDLI